MSARLAVIACCVLLAGTARADTVDATLTTLLTGHQDPRDGQLHTVIPLYETVSLIARIDARSTWLDDPKIVLSGWGGVFLSAGGDPQNGIATGDVDVGYLEGGLFGKRIVLRLGRQMVTGGAARVSLLDGLSVTLRLFRGLGVSGYGGLPVTPRFESYQSINRGDAQFGGRMFYRFSADAEAGLSFNQVLGEGRIARQDLGLDARWVPLPSLVFTAYGLLSIPERRFAEGDFALTWQPHAVVQVSADYRRTSPDLFLPLNSIFAVFSQETRDEVGGTLYLRPAARLRLYGDYHLIVNQDGQSEIGHRGGGKLSVLLGQRHTTSLNGEVRVLEVPANGYVQVRLYSIHHLLAALNATLGADAYFLDHPINGQTYSFTANTSLGYDLPRGFRAVVSGMADVTPFVERRFEFVAKLAYNHTLRLREVRK